MHVPPTCINSPGITTNQQLYLRNLLRHTVNYLLQKLNYVIFVKYSVVKQNSILFTSCVKISEQYLGFYAKYSLFNLKGSKSKVTKIGI